MTTLLLLASLMTMQYPNQTGFVTDAAGIFSADDVARLNAELGRYEAESTNEIVVVTVPSLGGQTIENYTSGLWQRWQVGKAGKDNGVILIFAPVEKKLRIQRGTGFRGVLTDAVAEDIIKNTIVPKYRMNDRGGAAFAGISAIERTLMASQHTETRYVPPAPVQRAAPAPPVVIEKVVVQEPIQQRVSRQPVVREEPTDWSGIIVIFCLAALIVMVVLFLRWKEQENEKERLARQRENDQIDKTLREEQERQDRMRAERLRDEAAAAARKTETPKVDPPKPEPVKASGPAMSELERERDLSRAEPKTTVRTTSTRQRKMTPPSRPRYTPPAPAPRSQPTQHHHHHNSSSSVAVVVVDNSAEIAAAERRRREDDDRRRSEEAAARRRQEDEDSRRSSYSSSRWGSSDSGGSSGSSWGGSSDSGGYSSDSGGGSSDGGGSSGDL